MQMSETPSLRAAKRTRLAVGRAGRGPATSSSGTGTFFFRILPSSAETRNRLRPFPVRPKKADAVAARVEGERAAGHELAVDGEALPRRGRSRR